MREVNAIQDGTASQVSLGNLREFTVQIHNWMARRLSLRVRVTGLQAQDLPQVRLPVLESIDIHPGLDHHFRLQFRRVDSKVDCPPGSIQGGKGGIPVHLVQFQLGLLQADLDGDSPEMLQVRLSHGGGSGALPCQPESGVRVGSKWRSKSTEYGRSWPGDRCHRGGGGIKLLSLLERLQTLLLLHLQDGWWIRRDQGGIVQVRVLGVALWIEILAIVPDRARRIQLPEAHDNLERQDKRAGPALGRVLALAARQKVKGLAAEAVVAALFAAVARDGKGVA